MPLLLVLMWVLVLVLVLVFVLVLVLVLVWVLMRLRHHGMLHESLSLRWVKLLLLREVVAT